MFDSKEITGLASNIDVNSLAAPAANQGELVDKFKNAWPTVKAVISAVKVITGKKMDAKIDQLIVIGDAIVGAAPDDVEEKIKNFCEVWNNVRAIVNTVSAIIPGKVGVIVRTFIKNLDLICDQYDADEE